MATLTLPDFAVGLPAARVDTSLRQALGACDRARESAVLWFAEVQRRGLYRPLGHASLHLYATQALGFSDNRYYQFKRLADDLDRLPVLREAVETGKIGWTKALQVARVATEATQGAWVEKATTTGRRELELQVRQARKRRPVAPAAQLAFDNVAQPAVADPPTTISLRADSVRLARFEALVEKAHKLGLATAGADRLDLVLAGLEAFVASAAGDEHTRLAGPAAQIIIQQCPDCERAAVTTSRGEKRLAPAQTAALACDAHVQRPGKANRATIKPSVRAAVLARDRYRCATQGCRSTSFLEVHHVKPRGRGGSNRAENLITLCSRCHGFVHEGGGAVVAAPAIVEPQALAPTQAFAQVGAG
jgi:5-methylcytosine-specific restriction endonuclease McrA